jgi:hypothetical protein
MINKLKMLFECLILIQFCSLYSQTDFNIKKNIQFYYNNKVVPDSLYDINVIYYEESSQTDSLRYFPKLIFELKFKQNKDKCLVFDLSINHDRHNNLIEVHIHKLKTVDLFLAKKFPYLFLRIKFMKNNKHFVMVKQSGYAKYDYVFSRVISCNIPCKFRNKP